MSRLPAVKTRIKLLLMVMIPFAALVYFSVGELLQKRAQQESAEAVSSLARLNTHFTGVIHQLLTMPETRAYSPHPAQWPSMSAPHQDLQL